MRFFPAAKGNITVLGMPVKEALKRNIVAYVPQSEEVDWSFPVFRRAHLKVRADVF